MIDDGGTKTFSHFKNYLFIFQITISMRSGETSALHLHACRGVSFGKVQLNSIVQFFENAFR
jgi:hypothetical protein